VLLLGAGWLWSGYFPVIKKLWTSSFVLVAAGWSAILLGAFYYLIDVRGWRRGFAPFVWIGMNAITLYLIEKFVDLPALAARLVGGPKSAVQTSLGSLGPLVASIVVVGIVLLIARFLYKRQIFLRV
jgi:predicted acyltransferase